MTRAKPQTAPNELRSIVERIERIEEQVKEFNADKSDIYKEAKSRGYDMKALREVVRLRRRDAAERAEHDAIVDLYLAELGMRPDDGTENAIARTHEITHQHGTTGPEPHDAVTTDPHAGARADTAPATHSETVTGGARQTPHEHAPVGNSLTLAAAGPNTVAALSDAEALEHPTFLLRGHPDCPVRA